MPSVAFLTLEEVGDFVIDDALAITEMRRRGWTAEEVPWSVPTDWSRYDLVVIRTTWDYYDRADEFMTILAQIEASGTRLENPRSVVAWNLDKQYLRELEARGVPMVPSVWGRGGTPDDFAGLFHSLQTTELVIKPTISGGARDTFRLAAPLSDETLALLATTFANRDWFAQPFVRAVLEEGEYSLFYFNGLLSHAIQKVPKAGDFRVQEEHGGEIIAVPPTIELQRVSDLVLEAIAPVPLQVRIDLIRRDDGELALMEVELIEPSLYLRMHPDAPSAFVDALEQRLHARG